MLKDSTNVSKAPSQTPHMELIAFVLDRAQDESTAKRARLYRALAPIVGEPAERNALDRLAYDLETADALCREFIFSFSQKTSH